MGIHKYSYENEYIVLDINSSNIFKCDKIMYDVLDHYPALSESETVSHFKGSYPASAVSEAVADIDELILAGRLFTALPSGVLSESPRPGNLKALCLNVAHDCNLSCRYCFASGGDFSLKKELMSEETAKKAIDFLIASSGGRRNLEVDFFGGEPLLNFDVVKKTVSYARSLESTYGKHFRFTITTNAVLLDEDILEYFNEEMDNVVLSLDGRKEVNDKMRLTLNGKGSYNTVSEKISQAIEYRGSLNYYVRATYTALNTDFSEDVVHLSELGAKNISAEPVVSDDPALALGEEHLGLLKHEYDKLCSIMLSREGKENAFSFFHFSIDTENDTCIYKKLSGCGAGTEYAAAAPDGDIYPCHQFVGKKEFRMGSVLDQTSDESVSEKFRKVNSLNRKECSSCWARYFCGGGCFANAFSSSGSIDGIYRFGCELLKKRLECALYINSTKKTLY